MRHGYRNLTAKKVERLRGRKTRVNCHEDRVA
jgi:hypothetical protein